MRGEERLENNLSAVADNSEVAAAIPKSSVDSAAVDQVVENNNNSPRDVPLNSEAELKATTTVPAQDADPSSADAQIESASEIETTSAQPPPVTVPESDLRENPTPAENKNWHCGILSIC